ncbi:MAG: hypothetical protein JSV20_01425, partial [Candidatus Bathyarchaeota archaeon]
MTKTKYDYYKTREVEALMMNILEKNEDVKPVFDLEFGYRYPSVEKAISMDSDKTIGFLDNLVKVEILNKQMYDMELRCPSCNSPNTSINYVCPKCASPGIRKTVLLEHHDCGYIGTIINFGEPLSCPNCGKRLEDNYRNAGSIYECSNCNQQIETPFIDHRCRKCGLKFSFENAIYQPKYAYLPTDLTNKEIAQGILYLSQVMKMFEDHGFARDANSSVIGESGAEHIFDLAFEGHGSKFYVDIKVSLDMMNDFDILKTYGKIRDVQTVLGDVDVFTLVIPGLDTEAETLEKSYNINIIAGKNPSVVLSKLKTILAEKISTLQMKTPRARVRTTRRPSIFKAKEEPKKKEEKVAEKKEEKVAEKKE